MEINSAPFCKKDTNNFCLVFGKHWVFGWSEFRENLNLLPLFYLKAYEHVIAGPKTIFVKSTVPLHLVGTTKQDEVV